MAVVNLWATWCSPCVEEMPYFISLHKNYGAKGVELISISADAKDTIDTAVKPFQKDHALPFPIHVLSESNPDATHASAHKELSRSPPETLLLDKTGKLVNNWEGPVTYEQLEEAVKAQL